MTQRRLVDMAQPHLAALETTIVAENWSGRVELRSALDGTVANRGVPRYRGLRGDHLRPMEAGAAGEDAVYLLARTSQSGIVIGEAARTRVTSGEPAVADRTTADRATGPRRPRATH